MRSSTIGIPASPLSPTMADEIHTKDPAMYCWMSSTDLKHNIAIVFTDAHGDAVFYIDSRPTSDTSLYRHQVSRRFSKVDTSIRIREAFATARYRKPSDEKVASGDDGMKVTATLMLPGASFAVERGEQEWRPYPEKACFVIQLVLYQTGIEREMLTFKHVGQNTTRLESECGELNLRRYLKRMGEVKGLTVLVHRYRGNRSFVGDEIREVLLPRFAVRDAARSSRTIPVPRVVGLAAVSRGTPVVDWRSQRQVDGSLESYKRKAEDANHREDAEKGDVEDRQTKRLKLRPRNRLAKRILK